MEINNKKYIPALRFPEFQNDGEWSMLELGKFAKIVMGQSPSSEAYNERGEGVPLLQGNADIKDRHQVVRVYTTDITKTCDINDIIMTVRAPVGTISRASFKSCIGRGVCAIKTDSEYLYQYLISIEQEWDKLASGSTFVSITSNQIFDRIIFVPLTIQEQKKIADCLSSLDKYIEATKRKLELLKEHKKGLMQRLFPAKGKTTPELRFPEFQDAGEWKNIKFSELFIFISNNTLSRASLKNNGGIVQNIHYGDVLIKYKENLSAITEEIPFITDINDIQKYISVKMENGDIIIADTAEDEIVGKCTEIQDITKEIIVAGLHTIAIRPNCKFAKYYLGFYLNSQSYRDQLTQYMQGVKVLAISKTSIAQTTICFPISLEEQEHIANCLMEINNSLKLIEEKIKVLELHKKGLMQQLFPKL